jgi:hypothetical protein
MFLEAGLDSGKEAVAVRFLKERFHALIELLKQRRLAPALQKAELQCDPHLSPYLLEVEDDMPVHCQLPSPGQVMFVQPAVFGIGEEFVDDLRPLWVAVSAVGGVAPACLRDFCLSWGTIGTGRDFFTAFPSDTAGVSGNSDESGDRWPRYP